jgi:hypothetical protein
MTLALTQGQRFIRGQAPDAENREKDDFYPTPPEGTRALLSAERFDGPIWEPACGDGAISKELIAAGYEVHSSDLVARGRAPNIVTNPPFKLALPFIERALGLTTGKVAMLLRLAFLEGRERRRFYESTPLARVLVFSGRLKMFRGGDTANEGGGMIAFAWFIWDHAHKGPPTLGWVTP